MAPLWQDDGLLRKEMAQVLDGGIKRGLTRLAFLSCRHHDHFTGSLRNGSNDDRDGQ